MPCGVLCSSLAVVVLPQLGLLCLLCNHCRGKESVLPGCACAHPFTRKSLGNSSPVTHMEHLGTGLITTKSHLQ